MYQPLSTYRFQFHHEFPLGRAHDLLDYLQALGIRTVYASPVLASRSGSPHGYDGIDPTRLDPELADRTAWEALHQALQQRGMGWLQDLVPNHLAYSPQNQLIREVFERGPLSEFYRYFDIDWQHPNPDLRGKVMLPVLGRDESEALAEGELKLVYAEGELQLAYYEHQYPVQPESYFRWLGEEAYRFEQAYRWLGGVRLALESQDGEMWALLKQRWGNLWAKDEKLQSYGRARLDQLNGDPEALRSILEQQHYRFCYWPLSDTLMNYRRFFTVNDLICLNAQDDAVFAHYHRWVLGEMSAGRIQGLRLDHIDGLYDPTGYLQQLRAAAGPDAYLVAEKILEQEEALPAEWPIEGTTGYEFLSRVSKLLTYGPAEEELDGLYADWAGPQAPWAEQVYAQKRHMLHHHLLGEWDNLFRLFQAVDWLTPQEQAELGDEPLRMMIGEFLLAMPVYRPYPQGLPLAPADRELVSEVLSAVTRRHPELSAVADRYAAAFVRDEFATDPQRQAAAKFLRRMLQFSGPLMAKGLEDTLFYRYHRFIAHNEVGDDPSVFHLEPRAFHAFMTERQARHPLSLNTLSTHDTKRGEDLRARLLVLSEMVPAWQELLQHWRTSLQGEQPDGSDAYFIAQTLAGAWPMDGQPGDTLAQRLDAYLEKALREAKRHSDWSRPNDVYEQAAQALARASLKPDSPFRQAFDPLFPALRDFGILNSLAQVLLKNTCPGTPDLYQGSESWNLSLVDPDNRRPVDYGLLQTQLQQIEGWQQENDWETRLWENRTEGQVKLWLTRASLQARQQYPALFAEGEYLPLEVKGEKADHVLAFLRRHGRQYAVVVVPRHLTTLLQGDPAEIPVIDWGDTRLVLPTLAPHDWTDQLRGGGLSTWEELPLAQAVGTLPVALLTGERPAGGRQAGVLLHVSSLPSAYGIGDLGPQARHFVDWLAQAGQSLWQVLPLNPVNWAGFYSPYAADSAFAGNPLLISPDGLEAEGHLLAEELAEHWLESAGPVDFETVEAHKQVMLNQAFVRFEQQASPAQRRAYRAFRQAEAHWLEDYALFRVLKDKFDGKPWSAWPEKTRHRVPEKLAKHRARLAQEIEQVYFVQFIFQQQWTALRQHAQQRGVRIFGDMPIYVSYDSADVWAHPELFKLKEDLSPETVAGVPPDYFSETGQLWGMPIFAWARHAADDYAWWAARVRRNLDFYDLLRLDHFRAFAAYWEVPAEEETAIHGWWSPGPGRALFDALQAQLGALPIVAEDLGDIDQAVYDLRDAYGFPGMRVLQFAFSPNMPHNLHIAHLHTPNSVAYTGTHDNNTLLGWYQNELDAAGQARLQRYLGPHTPPELLLWAVIRLLYSSAAETAIVPMQDLLGLGQAAMMNKPGTVEGNWQWRMPQWPPEDDITETLRQLVKLYGR
mgnify:CR=1 FL=1